MTDRTTHDLLERAVEMRHGDAVLFRYVHEAATPVGESTRPYFHPVRTLGGREVTVFRPEDHPWHHGLSFTATDVNGENFWGGPTYVPGRDYVELANQGRIRHDGWEAAPGPDGIAERLTWLDRAGTPMLTERRTVRVAGVHPSEGWWRMDLAFELHNALARPAVFSSPGAKGRSSGYGGLFWRGPASFTRGDLLAGGGLTGPGIMGRRAGWAAVVAPASWLPRCTVAIADDAANPGSPVPWFVRDEPYACLAPTFMYDTEWTLPAGAAAVFRYRVLIADGVLDHARIESILGGG